MKNEPKSLGIRLNNLTIYNYAQNVISYIFEEHYGMKFEGEKYMNNKIISLIFIISFLGFLLVFKLKNIDLPWRMTISMLFFIILLTNRIKNKKFNVIDMIGIVLLIGILSFIVIIH